MTKVLSNNIEGARDGAIVLGQTPAPQPQTTTIETVEPDEPQPPTRRPVDRGSPTKTCPYTIDAATTGTKYIL